MPRAAHVHVNLDLGRAPHGRAAHTGVVEAGMSQQQRTRELVAERLEQRSGGTIPVRVDRLAADLPGADRSLPDAVHAVDRAHLDRSARRRGLLLRR